MGAEQEAAVRAFMTEMEGEQQDAAQVDACGESNGVGRSVPDLCVGRSTGGP